MMKHITFKLSLLATLAMMVALSGCEDQAARERRQRPEVEEPPPPTPEEIAQKIIVDAQLNAPMPVRGSSLPPSLRQTVLDLLRREKRRLQGTEDGDRALAIVARKVDQRVRLYEREELWEHVLTLCDAHLIFKPNSRKFSHTRDKALLELRKPRVTVHGLPEFDGRKVAILTFYLPLTSQTYSEQMAIGEEMHGVRFLSVFGEDRGVRLEYLETGERFIAYLPRAM